MSRDLVVLGNLLVDDLVFPDGRTRMAQAGGAILYCSLAAALWGARAAGVSLQGEDYPEAMLRQLERRGIDLSGVHPLGRPGVRTWLLYEGRVRRVIHRLGGPTHEAVSPTPQHVPRAFADAGAFHLAPMPLEVQRTLLASFADGAFVSVDPHLPVTESTLARWREVLSRADAFFPSEDELQLEQAQVDPMAALPALVSGKLRFVVFKRGLKGGLLYDAREQRFHSWTARTNGIVDPTGAGDAFAMGFTTAHLAGLSVQACLQRAVVTASYAIEAWGPAGLLEATRVDAEARVRAWYREEDAS
ncbi:MAG: PfkB family carbohydrate kinase [Candidatus Eisenbacteria bacterium]